MYKTLCICVFLCITIPVLLAKGFGHGHHCRFYPYAPRCLGVAAKRSLEYDINNRATSLDVYSTLLKRILEETKRQKQSMSTGDQTNLLLDDQQSLYDRLSALLDKPRPDLFDTDAYTDGSDNWNDRLIENERVL